MNTNEVLLLNSGTQYEALFESFAPNEPKKWMIKGKFIECSKNGNGRTYGPRLIEMACEEYNRDYISKGRSVGCLNHPPSVHSDLEKVSHLIKKMTWDPHDKCCYGEAVILDTVCGLIAQNIFKAGGKLDVSSRGPGQTDKNTGEVLAWMCFGVDLVDIPSNQNCYADAIFESKYHICTLNPAMEKNYKELEKNYTKTQKYLAISKFMRELREG